MHNLHKANSRLQLNSNNFLFKYIVLMMPISSWALSTDCVSIKHVVPDSYRVAQAKVTNNCGVGIIAGIQLMRDGQPFEPVPSEYAFKQGEEKLIFRIGDKVFGTVYYKVNYVNAVDKPVTGQSDGKGSTGTTTNPSNQSEPQSRKRKADVNFLFPTTRNKR